MSLSMIISGKRVETYDYEKEANPIISRKRGFRGKNTPRLESRRDNVKRARDNFRRIICANLVGQDAPAFISLTFHQIISLKEAYTYLKQFIGRLRKNGYQNIRYISVPEYQKRGTIHYHVIIWGLPDSVILKEGSRGKGKKSRQRWLAWLKAKRYTTSDLATTRNLQRSWLQGYCDITPTDGNPQIASYMAKYLSKALLHKRYAQDFEDTKGQIRLFSASRNILRPLSLRGDSATIAMEEVVGVDNSPLQVREYQSEWRGRTIYKQYSLQNV